MIATALILTLLFTPLDQMFFRSESIPSGVNCTPEFAEYSIFCIASELQVLDLARWLSVALLALVISGIAPALTAIPHWYVTWSFMISSTVVDGGDHLASNLTLLLIPLMLLDRRRWHWARDTTYERRSAWTCYAAYSVLFLWVLQMMGVYFQASVAKFSVQEWSDGTALWYWMQNPTFSPPGVAGDVVRGLLQHVHVSVALTYGALVLQMTLVLAVFFSYRLRIVLLAAAVAFHLLIAVGMGLWSFSLVMIAADLLLLLRPHESNELPEVRNMRFQRERQPLASH